MRHRGGSACSLLLLSPVMALGGVRVVGAAGRRTTAAAASPRPEGGGQCLTCHRGIEDAHPKNPLPCTQCHRGDAMAPSREKAHAGMWANPSDLRIVERTCGPCHTRIARTVPAAHPTGHPPVPGPVRRLDPPRQQLPRPSPLPSAPPATTAARGRA